MDQFFEIAKAISLVATPVLPFLKVFLLRVGQRPKHLQARHNRIKQFFEEGGTDQHPMLVETSFAAAVGHSRLGANEIAFILLQREPMRFLEGYLSAIGSITLCPDGQRLELKGVAKYPVRREVLVVVYFLLYVLVVLASAAVLLYGLPGAVAHHQSGQVLALLGTSFCGLGFAVVLLLAAIRLNTAARLVKAQVEVRHLPNGSSAVADVLPTVPSFDEVVPAHVDRSTNRQM